MSITTEVINGPVSIFELGSVVLLGLGLILMIIGIAVRATGSEKNAPDRLHSAGSVVALLGMMLFGGSFAADAAKEDRLREGVLEQITQELLVTNLATRTDAIDLCYEDSAEDAQLYVWRNADGDPETGTLKKSAEADGACTYSLTAIEASR